MKLTTKVEGDRIKTPSSKPWLRCSDSSQQHGHRAGNRETLEEALEISNRAVADA